MQENIGTHTNNNITTHISNVNRNNFEIMEAIWHGWEVFKREWKNLLMLVFAYAVATLPLNIIDGVWNMRLYNTEIYLPEGAEEEVVRQTWAAGTSETVLYVLFAVIMFAWGLIVGYNWYKSFYTVYDGKKFVFAEMFKIPSGDNWKNFLNYYKAMVAYVFMVCVGFVFLIVPGVYLAIRYGQAFSLILDKNYDVEEAFAMSSKMTEGIKWKLLGTMLVQGVFTLGLVLVGLVALLVGVIPAVFAAFGWSMMTSVGLYRKLYAANA